MAQYCYTFNASTGISMLSVGSGYTPQPGEVLFPIEATDQELMSAFPDYGPYLAAQQALAMAQAKLASLLAAGVEVTSMMTPAINGVYDISDAGQTDISDESNYIQSTGNTQFTNGEATIAWPLLGGVDTAPFPNPPTFIRVAQGIAKYIGQAKAAYRAEAMGQSATWPTTPISVN